jgi:hypothetical protein
MSPPLSTENGISGRTLGEQANPETAQLMQLFKDLSGRSKSSLPPKRLQVRPRFLGRGHSITIEVEAGKKNGPVFPLVTRSFKIGQSILEFGNPQAWGLFRRLGQAVLAIPMPSPRHYSTVHHFSKVAEARLFCSQSGEVFSRSRPTGRRA